MAVLLADISALEFWRYAAHVKRVPTSSARRVLEASLEKPSFQEVERLLANGFSFLSDPVHLLVPDEGSRCRAERVLSHVAPSESFCRDVVRIKEGLYVVEPEVCLLELAVALPFPQLLEVVFEFCGEYARSVGDFKEIARRAPLTSVSKLEFFLDRVGCVHGSRAMRKAVRFALDRSRSPMETVTVVFLCLPVRMGGYGLPNPVMNAVIPVPAKDRPFVKKSYYECDLYWPEAKFAIEYDSNLHHTGATRIAEDASRRVDLAYLGVEVATLTQQQAYDRREMDRIARLLAKRLGKRMRAERIDIATQNDLRSCLLGPWHEEDDSKTHGQNRRLW